MISKAKGRVVAAVRTRLRLLVLLGTIFTLVAGTTAATTTTAGASANDPIFTVVNASGGVYWRDSPNWNDPIKISGQGVYDGDRVLLQCYELGGPVPPYGNTLWYYAEDLSRFTPDGYYQNGLVSDHFLNTPGTAAHPQPQGSPCE